MTQLCSKYDNIISNSNGLNHILSRNLCWKWKSICEDDSSQNSTLRLLLKKVLYIYDICYLLEISNFVIGGVGG